MKTRTLEESSELLRMALPLMAKHTIPVTPDNYSVWYEYVAGDNQALKERLDKVIADQDSINEEVICSIRESYLEPKSDMAQVESAQETLTSLNSEIEKVLASACGEARLYEKSLESYQGKMTEDLKVEQLATLISELSVSTSSMNKRNKELMDDLAENQHESEQLRKELVLAKKEAKTDPLTSLGNRAAFAERVEQMDESGELKEGQHCLLIADIDKFKLVNDTYGHIFGDKVIKAVAKILKDNTKGKDFPARFGGEEFIVLLPDTDIKGAFIVAETIRKKLESAVLKKATGAEGEIRRVTISIGATKMVYGDSIETSISHADEALYKAKEGGRNQVKIYSK